MRLEGSSDKVSVQILVPATPLIRFYCDRTMLTGWDAHTPLKEMQLKVRVTEGADYGWKLSHAEFRDESYLFLAISLAHERFAYLSSACAAVLQGAAKITVSLTFDRGAEPSAMRQRTMWSGAVEYSSDDEDCGGCSVVLSVGNADSLHGV
jgi:hypothetical protein